MKRVLLVEDELHKREELSSSILLFFAGNVELVHVDSVHAAYWAASADEFDLIILDMALPTFSIDSPVADRGLDQALGGVEVLRALKARGVNCKVIIITQYPDINVGGRRLKLSDAPSVLSKRYSQSVIGAVLYKYKSPSNSSKITALLKKI
jgi:CheY-like chemotaxis protein